MRAEEEIAGRRSPVMMLVVQSAIWHSFAGTGVSFEYNSLLIRGSHHLVTIGVGGHLIPERF